MLELVVQRTQAWELLHTPDQCSRLSTDDFYNTMLRAGYSTEEAQKAANQRGWDKLSAGESL